MTKEATKRTPYRIQQLPGASGTYVFVGAYENVDPDYFAETLIKDADADGVETRDSLPTPRAESDTP